MIGTKKRWSFADRRRLMEIASKSFEEMSNERAANRIPFARRRSNWGSG
jgi:hypothetical protein